MHIDTEEYRVKPGAKFDMKEAPVKYKGKIGKEEGEKEFDKLVLKLTDLQELLYADGKQSLLVVLQAMDAGGKDSTIQHVFGPINPQGCNIISFKGPNNEELSHDYLWRVHKNAPARGYMTVFNRSHYEDVLIVKVKKFAPKERIEARYEHINHFEKMLSDEGTRIVKFYLNISKDYQKERFERRLEKPEKNWKFNPEDLESRKDWDKYMDAFGDVFEKCSTKSSPWYVVPAETRWFRDLLVTRVLVDILEGMGLKYPVIDYDPASVKID
jgi:PPK2 family polyphosphate:nucleotide phosphotransferase